MDTGLLGRTAVVTGGNSNIGRGIVLALAAEGANVVIAARDAAAGERVREQALAAGAKNAVFHSVDVVDRAQVGRMVVAVEERFGAVDLLVNNVGGNVAFAYFVESDPDTWRRDIDLNFTSTLNCAHAVLPGMINRASGRIINIGSTAGLIGDPTLAVYSAMKGAVHTFTKILAKEVGPHGITVNAVAPYGTLPDDWANDVSAGSRWHADGVIAKRANGGDSPSIGRRTVLERQTATPREIAAAVVYLASDAAAFVTGQILAVEGGTLLA
ncbi:MULTISPECIES: SDR family NAD(P)-dependent oxidoreductase [Pseudofrankia]|uniref:SDR family NAD(P)-dependent oxidoreductase n=1 Tax=Pseudofrankia TaxID=2994363 RepID=UPI000234DBA3|nr:MULTISPECIES: SDR family NAD(P)-dependent oxidoreductase [Pseudofrankia]OHV36612.1 short-chain dehydrogenase [Pseudofrankia sp. EUN1h]